MKVKQAKERPWPAETIERHAVADLVPYARNARTHSKAQVAKIAASIKEWGWTNPILVDEDGGIIAGHGRLLAAHQLNIAEVPCMVAKGWTQAQKQAYVIADNQLTLDATWDEELLKVELGELRDHDFDLSLTGFDDDDLAKILAESAETEQDEIPDVPEDARTKLGDVWILGDHKVVCGDAMDPAAWDALEVPDKFVCFTSPPYNLGDNKKLRGPLGSSKRDIYVGHNDEMSEADYTAMIDAMLGHALQRCACAVFNVQPIAGSKRVLTNWMATHAKNLCDIVTWDKGHAAPAMAPGVLSSTYEWLIIFAPKSGASRKIPLATWRGTVQSVYHGPKQTQNDYAEIHGATFPVHLPAFVMAELMNMSAGVVDCCMGTGTTLIAAQQLGRKSLGIEIDPRYVDVVCSRWQTLTGKTAIRVSDGVAFDDAEIG